MLKESSLEDVISAVANACNRVDTNINTVNFDNAKPNYR